MKQLTSIIVVALIATITILSIQLITLHNDLKRAEKELIEIISREAEEKALNDYITFQSAKAVAIATEYNDSIGNGNDNTK